MTAPNTLASTEARRTANLAVSTSAGETKASSAMKSATVKPTPASAATPKTIRGEIPSGSRPIRARVAAQMAASIPSGLPTTSPRRMPSPSGLVTVSLNVAALTSMPAFASANAGTTIRLVHGCSDVSTRSSGVTARLAMSSMAIQYASASSSGLFSAAMSVR